MAEQETEEPSIEEILTSIRQIISDDDEEGGEDAPAEEKVMDYSEDEEGRDSDLDLSPEDEEDRDSDLDLSAEDEEGRDSDLDLSGDDEEVIELTEAIDDEPEPEPEPKAPEPVEEKPEIEVDLQDAKPEAPKPAPAPSLDDLDDLGDSVLTDSAKGAAYDGFSELARKTAVETDGITLEEIVRTELNPLLKNWLDKNLPTIIERLVQDELQKIAKRATDDQDV